jgi:hypothetical protein
MSLQDFAELKDSARISIGVGPMSLVYLGRLDKLMLDK